jgi:hypothetical protein
MAVRNLAPVQRLPGSATVVESRSGRIGPISLEANQTGERSAGNPHAAFDEAGAGNVAWSRWCDTRRRKGETTGNTNFDLHWRASPRPYLREAGGEIPPAYSPEVFAKALRLVRTSFKLGAFLSRQNHRSLQGCRSCILESRLSHQR